MLNIRDLRIDPASLGSKKLLVDITPAYEYKDGKRTDNLTGYRYTVGRNTAYDLIRCGKIRSVRIGHKIRIPKDSLLEFLQEN